MRHTPPHRSLWLEQALPGEQDAPALHGDVHCDVVIVGGGFVGLWTALQLATAEPDAAIVVLEADVCGAGASGRNGGFVLSWWPKAASLERLCGTEGALALLDASVGAIDRIERFCQEHAPAAEFRRGGLLWTATTNAQLGAWDGVVDAARRLGRPDVFTALAPEDVARRSGSPVHRAGVLEASGATVQPAALVRALRQQALRRGVRIYEHSPMTRLRRERPVAVGTPSGTVHAGKVVLALNAWACRVPELRRKLFVISSDVVATEPVPERLAALGWTGGEGITDSQTLVCYYRTTAEGRLVFGKGGWAIGLGSWLPPAMERHRGRAAMVEADLRRYYPSLFDVRITHDWAGPIDRTYNSLPVFGRIGRQDDICYGIGWSGNGVGPSVVGATILTSIVLDRHDQWSENGLVNAPHRLFPVEPVRYVGAHLVREAIKHKERREALELDVGWLPRALARLAPSGLEDKE